jgi:predicted HAD superfamily phosphohydrolase YqeG
MKKDYLKLALSRRHAEAIGLRPDIYLERVLDFDPEPYGLKLLIFDWEGTLCPWGISSPLHGVKRYMADMKARGYQCKVLSNLTTKLKEKKRERFAEYVMATTGLELVLNHPYKPSGEAVRVALSGTPPNEAAIIGDIIYTDMLAASRAGLGLLVLVEPADRLAEPLYMRLLVRPIEDRYKRRLGLERQDLNSKHKAEMQCH